jgi:hypothetical protein
LPVRASPDSTHDAMHRDHSGQSGHLHVCMRSSRVSIATPRACMAMRSRAAPFKGLRRQFGALAMHAECARNKRREWRPSRLHFSLSLVAMGSSAGWVMKGSLVRPYVWPLSITLLLSSEGRRKCEVNADVYTTRSHAAAALQPWSYRLHVRSMSVVPLAIMHATSAASTQAPREEMVA